PGRLAGNEADVGVRPLLPPTADFLLGSRAGLVFGPGDERFLAAGSDGDDMQPLPAVLQRSIKQDAHDSHLTTGPGRSPVVVTLLAVIKGHAQDLFIQIDPDRSALAEVLRGDEELERFDLI